MREPGNIRELIEYEPDFMGFIFYPGSKRFVPEPDPEIFNEIPSGIRKVGVFVNEETETLRQVAANLKLDLVQLHGDETPGECVDLKNSGIPVMKAFRIFDSIDEGMLRDYEDGCDYFLFDTGGQGFGGTGKQFDWGILESFQLKKPFFLSGGIGPEDISAILDLDHPAMAGIDINSRFEIEPGLKDLSRVGDFIQSIRRKQQ